MSARLYINHIRRILNQKLTNYQNTDNQMKDKQEGEEEQEGMPNERDIVYDINYMIG